NADWLFWFGGSFTNHGTILKTNTANATLGAVPVNNDGTIHVAAGTLQLDENHGGVWSGTSTIVVDASAKLLFDGIDGSDTFSGTINGSGAGLVQFDSGTITIGAAGLDLN